MVDGDSWFFSHSCGPSHSSMIMTGLTPGGCSDSMCRVFQSSIISYRVFEYEAPHGHCARYIVIG